MHSLIGFLVLTAATANAQDAAFWSFLTSGRPLPRCAEASLAYQDAAARLGLLDEYVDRLPDSINAAAAVGELHALLKSECFLPAAETDRIPNPDSTLALKRWWTDGGRDWLASYLRLPSQHVVLPPDVRYTLAASLDPDDPLRALVCRLDDAACGAETLGWVQRAEDAFDVHRVIRIDSDWRLVYESLEPVKPTPESASGRCAQDLPTGDATRYQTWRDCLESQRPKTSALPLGRIKVPRTGWLIVSGRRGHYGFCDTVSAYDLDTGAAFVYESCSGLQLNRDGSVDPVLTDAGRKEKTRWGRLSADDLREALWMMLLQEHTERMQIHAEWYPLPAGLAPEAVARGPFDDVNAFGAGSVSTAETILAWRWVPSRGRDVSGELTWPGSFDGAADHATSLFNIAELSLVPGCVPRRAPSESVLGLPEMRVHPLDAPPEDRFYRNAAAAYKQWSRATLCSNTGINRR